MNKQHEREEGCIDAAFGSCYCNDTIVSFFRDKVVGAVLVAGFAVRVGER